MTAVEAGVPPESPPPEETTWGFIRVSWPNMMLELGSGFVMRISIRNYSFIAHDMLSR